MSKACCGLRGNPWRRGIRNVCRLAADINRSKSVGYRSPSTSRRHYSSSVLPLFVRWLAEQLLKCDAERPITVAWRCWEKFMTGDRHNLFIW
jgi:hypothetical protein